MALPSAGCRAVGPLAVFLRAPVVAHVRLLAVSYRRAAMA